MIWQLVWGLILCRLTQSRHPELVSGSIPQQGKAGFAERWMLKHVQHDGEDKTSSYLLIVSVDAFGFNDLEQLRFQVSIRCFIG